MTSNKRNSRAAKRVLEQAVPHIGGSVIVIGPGSTGDGYLATSMPTKSADDLEPMITMVNEALKKLRRWQRRRRLQEKRQLRLDEEET